MNDLPRFGIASKKDKAKEIQIAMEMMPIGIEFDKKIKEIAKKYYKEYPGETSNALMNIMLTNVNAIGGNGQAIHILIEMLYKQHVHDALKEAVPMDDAKKIFAEAGKELKIFKDSKEIPSSEEMNKFFGMFEDKANKIEEEKKGDDKPNYFG